jgi:hypothetical protein
MVLIISATSERLDIRNVNENVILIIIDGVLVEDSLKYGHQVRYVTNRKVAGSRPDEVNDLYKFT